MVLALAALKYRSVQPLCVETVVIMIADENEKY